MSTRRRWLGVLLVVAAMVVGGVAIFLGPTIPERFTNTLIYAAFMLFVLGLVSVASTLDDE